LISSCVSPGKMGITQGFFFGFFQMAMRLISPAKLEMTLLSVSSMGTLTW
jgi:hypothetical protein